MIATAIVVIFWIGFYFWYFFTYNRLVAIRNAVPQTWAHVDVELQRRYDLISNLVEVVKAYAKHESEVFSQTTRERTVTNCDNNTNLDVQEANLLALSDTSLLSNIMVVVEQYPELKADEQFLSLQNSLVQTENRIAERRNTYNECVSRYEISRSIYPDIIVAWAGHFSQADFFDAENESTQAIKVDLQ